MSKELVEGELGVTILGRGGIRYREGARVVAIDGEMLTGAFDLVVYTGSIKVWDDTKKTISNEERKQIVANMESVFRKHGLTVDFEK
jgi:hypothetical protein